MWQDLFRRADLITRLSQSPWSPYLDEFAAFLSEQHYSTGTIRRALVSADHFACWLSERQLSLSDTSATIVAQYRDSLGCPSGSRPECGPLPFMQAEAYQTSRTSLQPNPPVLCEGCSL